MQFTNKEMYLAYRSAWKAEYNTLSQTIREKKWMRKEWSRAHSKAMVQLGIQYYPNWNSSVTYGKRFDLVQVFLKENERYQMLKKKYDGDRKWLEKYQEEATVMLEELKLAKQEAQRQYLASRKMVVA